MTMGPGFSDDDVKILIADTLRLFVGLGRRLSWADLAEATGDDERKLRSYVESPPPAMPSPVFARVFTVLPPEAFARVARRMGFTAGPIESDGDATVRRTLAQASRLVAEGNEYLEDNRITPTERAQLAQSAQALLPTLTAMATSGTSH